jgi:hypothetical protein
MNNELTLDDVQMCRIDRAEGLLSFLVSRSKSASRSLTPSASDVLRGCADAVNEILRTAIETRNEAEFDRVFNESFSKYIRLTMAISNFATAVIQKPLREQLVRESICEMEADFRDKGLEAFGATVRDQAMFTVWTLRKINDLTTQINAIPMVSARESEDEEFCSNFNINALRAHFSLDCLNMALDDKRAIYPEVLEELVDGMRAMVNAYTWARRGLDIRIPSEELLPNFSEVDDDDAALMDLSFSEASEWLDDKRGMDAVK